MNAKTKPYALVVPWGDTMIPWDEAKRRAKEAKKLCIGISVVTTEQRRGYEGENYTVPVPDYFGIAQVIERARKAK